MEALLPKFEFLDLQLKKSGQSDDGGYYLIATFNRPERKNAFNQGTYSDVTNLLRFATEDDRIRVVILTGKGDYYSSGNDLSVFTSAPADMDKAFGESAQRLVSFVDAFIRFPKILIGAINGPAIGIAATTLSHCDFVYASETATFNTPFTSLAQSPEACSSVLFPQILGSVMANEVLLLGKKLNAREALDYRMVNQVFPAPQLMNEVCKIADTLSSLPPESLMASKKLIKSPEVIKRLEEINRKETAVLIERWRSTEFMQTIMNFLSRRRPQQSKL